jgi:hypothetical protein
MQFIYFKNRPLSIDRPLSTMSPKLDGRLPEPIELAWRGTGQRNVCIGITWRSQLMLNFPNPHFHSGWKESDYVDRKNLTT